MPDASLPHCGCSCGQTTLAVSGPAIMSTVCYCDDCQEGWRQIEALPGAGAARDADGGTPYVLYRRDRLKPASGSQMLKGYRLKDGSPTERVVATCCNTPMYLDFNKGHWLSACRARFSGAIPPVTMRIQTRFRTATGPYDDDAPRYKTFPLRFIGKLLAARVAMLFSH